MGARGVDWANSLGEAGRAVSALLVIEGRGRGGRLQPSELVTEQPEVRNFSWPQPCPDTWIVSLRSAVTERGSRARYTRDRLTERLRMRVRGGVRIWQ